LGDTADAVVLLTAGKGMVALAPRLDRAAATRAFAVVVPLIEHVNGIEAARAIERVNGIEAARAAAMALSEQMGPEERRVRRRRVGQATVAGLKRLRDLVRLDGAWDGLSFAIDQFEPVIEPSVTSGDLTVSNIGNLEVGYLGEFTIGASLVSTTSDLATIADCLRHPACTGHNRQLVLHRLEELAFPPADDARRQAVAESVVTGLTQPMAGGVLAAGRQVQWERQRKFRTTWDAVAWLNQHHPEIDLDKPYTPRK
jgi:hypothetical protein